MDNLVIKGNWENARSKVQRWYNDLNEEDLNFEGNVDQLINKVQNKLGKTRDEVVKILDNAQEAI